MAHQTREAVDIPGSVEIRNGVCVLATLGHQTFLLDHHYLRQASGLPWLAALEIFLLCWQVSMGAMILPSSMHMVQQLAYAVLNKERSVALPLVLLAGYSVLLSD